MTDLEDELSPTMGVGTSTSWDNLPERVKIQALAQGLSILANNGYPPFDSKDVSAALGPDQLRLIAESLTDKQLETIGNAIAFRAVEEIDDSSVGNQIARSLDEEQLQAIATHIPTEPLTKKTAEEGVASTRSPVTMEQERKDLVTDEVNRRVVAPLILGTSILLFVASIGAFLTGSPLLGFLTIPGPILGFWSLWKMTQQ